MSFINLFVGLCCSVIACKPIKIDKLTNLWQANSTCHAIKIKKKIVKIRRVFLLTKNNCPEGTWWFIVSKKKAYKVQAVGIAVHAHTRLNLYGFFSFFFLNIFDFFFLVQWSFFAPNNHKEIAFKKIILVKSCTIVCETEKILCALHSSRQTKL